MNTSMMGTPINELNNDLRSDSNGYNDLRNLQDMQQTQYGGMQMMQGEQSHNAQDNMHQAQHDPYYKCANCGGFPTDKRRRREEDESEAEIDDITKDIVDTLKEDTFDSVSEGPDKPVDNSLLGRIPHFLKDPLIVLVLFLILSHPIARDTIGKYVRATAPGEDGAVGFTGILIYGIIFATLFGVVKYFVN